MTDSSSRPTPTTAPTPMPDRRGRNVGVLLVLGVIVAAVLAVWYVARPDETGVDQSVRTEAAFDFDQHTFCDWFTADEMERIVADAQARAELDVELESFATSGECRVVNGPREAIWETPGWQSQSDGGLGIWLAPVITDPRGSGLRSIDPADFERHPLLDDRLTVGNVSYGFAYSPGVSAQLRVTGHEDEVLFLGFGVEGNVLTDSQQTADFGLVVADLMLEHMNWTD